MDTYLVAYDICDPNRLRKVAKICEDFGMRRQYSVFVCRLAAVDLVRLKSRLYDVSTWTRTRFSLFPCAAAAPGRSSPWAGRSRQPTRRDVVIVR